MKNIENKQNIDLYILVGLPGSGKTTYANRFENGNKDCFGDYNFSMNFPQGNVISVDKIYSKMNVRSYEFDWEMLKKYIFNHTLSNIVVVDGLFHTQEQYQKLIKLFTDNKNIRVSKVYFKYWIPNVDACLWNDAGRRKGSSEETIFNLGLEKPNVAELQKIFSKVYPFPIELEEIKIIKKPGYIYDNEVRPQFEIVGNQYLCSESWSIGDGTDENIDIEKYMQYFREMSDFKEFDKFLEVYYPKISYLQYREAFRRSVTLKEHNSFDYYSRDKYAFWCCDLNILWEYLRELKVV